MWRRRSVVLAGLAAAGLSSSAAAGVADPVPLINGTAKATHVFTVPGIFVDIGTGVGVICTSLEKSKNVAIAIEIFTKSGTVVNDVTTGSGVDSSVSPGETTSFEISDDAGGVSYLLADQFVINAGQIVQGSLRILATSTKIACTAVNLDSENSPPNFVWPLNVVSKTKQKGD